MHVAEALRPVSVVIPAWNAAGHIRRALDSVLRQTVRPREIIVVDDGSTDGTAGLVAEYEPAVACLRQPHSGLSVARNEGVALATSSWIAFLDADDEWLPSKLERQLAILERYPSLPWCSCHRRDLDAGRAVEVGPRAALSGLTERPILPFMELMAAGLSAAPSGMVVNRALLRDAGGFDPSLRYSQDRDLWLRIALRHPWIGYSPEVGVHYHEDRPESLMNRSRDRTEGLAVVCRQLEAWRAAGDRSFDPVAHRLILGYFIRSTYGRVTFDAAARARAAQLVKLSLLERLLLRSLAMLPTRIAQAIGTRLAVRPLRRRLTLAPLPSLPDSGHAWSPQAP